MSYFIDVMGSLSEKAERIAAISPFHYLDTSVMQLGYHVRGANLAFFLIATAVCAAVALIAYNRKDIQV